MPYNSGFRTVLLILFFFSLERRCQQDNVTFNSLIATSSLAICMAEMEGEEEVGGGEERENGGVSDEKI